MEKQDYIIEKARELFLKRGINTVSMDDLAGACGISKKTIYLHFDNKRKILEQVVIIEMENWQEHLNKISESEPDSLDALRVLFDYLHSLYIARNIFILNQLKKYHIDLYERVVAMQTVGLTSFLSNNIRDGINKNIYREAINNDELIGMCTNVVKLLYFENKDCPSMDNSILILGQFFAHYQLRDKDHNKSNKKYKDKDW